MNEKPVNLPQHLFDIDTIYHEPNIESYPRAREILARFPGANLIEVPSHHRIPGLHGNAGNAADWLQIKRNVLVLGARKSLKCEANNRSSDFIAPGLASGLRKQLRVLRRGRHLHFDATRPKTRRANSGWRRSIRL